MSPHPDLRAAVLALGAGLDPVPGVEGVFIRRLSIAEMDGIAELESGAGHVLLYLALCDKDEQLLFTPDDIAEIGKMKPETFRSLYAQAIAFNHLTITAVATEEPEAAADVAPTDDSVEDALLKN